MKKVIVAILLSVLASTACAQTYTLHEGEWIVGSMLPPRLEAKHRWGIVWTVLAGFGCYYFWAHERSVRRAERG